MHQLRGVTNKVAFDVILERYYNLDQLTKAVSVRGIRGGAGMKQGSGWQVPHKEEPRALRTT